MLKSKMSRLVLHLSFYHIAHKKSFLLRISSVNLTKHEKILTGKRHFLYSFTREYGRLNFPQKRLDDQISCSYNKSCFAYKNKLKPIIFELSKTTRFIHRL